MVEWKFVGRMMMRMGFCPIFVRWIMACVSSVSYSFNLNGERVGYITASRGLRQGDPLSPYLFLICAEGLSYMINREMNQGNITGVKVCKNGPQISHLFFADDSVICCKATVQEAKQIKEILQAYSKASGQVINCDKSAVYFSRNTTRQARVEVCQELGDMREASSGRYLGLPMAIGRSKNQVFGYIKSSIMKKLKGWKNKMLSPAGKEVLIKSVIQAMPNYAMACFKLPKGLCKDICKCIANFWWGSGQQDRKMHWLSWKKLSEVKGKGGLGFRDLEAFNEALLAKQLWRILTSPNLLMSKVLREKYLKDPNALDKNPPQSASWSWKSVHSAGRLIQRGMWKRIGDGSQVNIWKDRWIIGTRTGTVTTSRAPNCQIQTVNQLIKNGRWNAEIIKQILNPEDSMKIISMPLSCFRRKDRLFWSFSKSGQYTVKTGYANVVQERSNEMRRDRIGEETSWEIRKHSFWKRFWKLNLKHKLKLFIWRSLQNSLATKETIYNRTGKGDRICSGCGEDVETMEHMFFKCPIAQTVWKIAPVRWDGLQDLQNNLWRWWEAVSQTEKMEKGKERICLTANILWQIWKSRNKAQFENEKGEARKIIGKAQQEWTEYEEVIGRERKDREGGIGSDQQRRVRESPKEGIIRIHTDAAISAKLIRTGKGIIARHWTGEILRARGVMEMKIGVALMEEALTIRMALQMARRAGWGKIEVMSDCKTAVDMITSNNVQDGLIATILEDIEDLIKGFDFCTVLWVPRSANVGSHRLAQFATKLVNDIDWENNFPMWLIEAANKDWRAEATFCN
ncbi:uncharacterized protein [Coffea arabica]|uniref:Reverse transcriptase domain-containing protein n=1 Tax=Coffea arabica TaxID=13443 RepID=A0ABM4U5L4_COFAR